MNFFAAAQAAKKEEQLLVTQWTGKDVVNKAECMCVRWSNDGKQVAAGGGDGVVRLYNGDNGNLMSTLFEPKPQQRRSLPSLDDVYPVMAIRFAPKMAGRIRVASSSGNIELIEVKSKIQKSKSVESGNQTLAIDYSPDGTKWASGGTDRIVRIYDESRKEPLHELSGSLAGVRGHSNRICAVRFHPSNPAVVVSSGLDGTAMGWDYLTEDAYGRVSQEPFFTLSDLDVRGDALDFDCDSLLVGSWRPAKQLTVWDMRSGREELSIPWNKKSVPKGDAYPVAASAKSRWGSVRDAVRGSCNVYAAQYVARGPHLGAVIAGGTGSKELKVFTRNREAAQPEDAFDAMGSLTIPSGVQGLHVAPDGMRVAVASFDGTVYSVKLPAKQAPPPKTQA